MIKLKVKLVIIYLKKYFFTIVFSIFIISLLAFSQNNIQAAKSGLLLWSEAVIPSLLPFFIASNLLCKTNIISICGKYLGKLMRPLFNLPGESAIALLIGIISGYPVGAKIVCELLDNNSITKEEAERLTAFCNNSGPLFIVGTVGISLFSNKSIGILLLVTHILASISVGIIYKYWSPNTLNKKNKNVIASTTKYNFNTQNITFRNLGETIGSSIISSINSILLVGGFIVLFSVVLSILKSANIFSYLVKFDMLLNLPIGFFESIFSGILELTNGLKALSILNFNNENFKIIMSAFLLGLGGISVLLQVFSIISQKKLSIKTYLIGKILQAILASLYTSIYLIFIL